MKKNNKNSKLNYRGRWWGKGGWLCHCCTRQRLLLDLRYLVGSLSHILQHAHGNAVRALASANISRVIGRDRESRISCKDSPASTYSSVAWAMPLHFLAMFRDDSSLLGNIMFIMSTILSSSYCSLPSGIMSNCCSKQRRKHLLPCDASSLFSTISST